MKNLLKFFQFCILLALTMGMIFSPVSSEENKKDINAALARISQEQVKYNLYWHNPVPKKFFEIFNKAFVLDSETNTYIAKNTMHLNGLTEENYLKKSNNCPTGQKVVGIRDGKIDCDYTQPMLVRVKVYSGKPTYPNYLRPDNNWWITVGQEARFTTGTEEAELVFDDGSLLRMANNTSILLSAVRPQNTNGKTIAQAQYESGLLWGRVLNPDKLRFASEGVIVGVRGTSVMIEKKWEINVLQSRDPIATIYNSEWRIIQNVPKCHRITKNETKKFANDEKCIGNNPIVAENTIKDIAYLNTIQEKGNQKANNELKIATKSTACGVKDKSKPVEWSMAKHKYEVCQPKETIGMMQKEGDNYILIANNKRITINPVEQTETNTSFDFKQIRDNLGVNQNKNILINVTQTNPTTISLYYSHNRTLKKHKTDNWRIPMRQIDRITILNLSIDGQIIIQTTN